MLTFLNTPEIIKTMGDFHMTEPSHMAAMSSSWSLDPSNSNNYTGFAMYMAHLLEDDDSLSAKKGDIIGWGSLRHVWNLQDIGYGLLPQFWGKGFATEIGREMMRFTEKDLGIEKFVGYALETNIASCKVLSKCGLELKESRIFKKENGEDGKIAIYARPGLEYVPIVRVVPPLQL